MKKKRLLTLLLTLVALVAMLTVSVAAYSYPSVFLDVDDWYQTAEKGETVKFHFTVSQGSYRNERLYIKLYYGDKVDPSELLSEKDYNMRGLATEFTYSLDTTEATPGTYTLEYYCMFYSFNQWNETPYHHTMEFTLTPKPCPNGHTWDDGVITKKPTCEEAGTKLYTCTVCGTTSTEDVAATGHTWGEAVVTKAATCVEEGEQTYTCSVCGKTWTEAIPTTDHTWGEAVVTKAATCVEEGEQTYTCSVCGKTWTEALPTTDHTWGDWTVTTAASIRYAGTETRTCTVCGAEETREIPATGNTFADVGENDYFYTPVLWAADHGITTGKTTTRFAPGDTCTRAQVVTFLWRAVGSVEPQTTENPFTDVPADSYYYKAVLWGYENGIVKGMSDTTFAPDAVITREQAVTFLWRCYGGPDPQDANCPFEDVSSNYAYNAILWAVEQNVTQGTSATTFAPKNNCTRGQIVTFLYRAMH